MVTLLIDDDPFALKLLTRQLARAGMHEVQSCSGARQALARLAAPAADIDLVFCDLQMPDMDGVEFVRHLAGLGYGGHLVLFSAEDGRVLQAVHRLASAHGLSVLATLGKPVMPELLDEVLADHLKCGPPRPARPGGSSPDVRDLRLAIAGAELLNHYQPKVRLATGALDGVEALVRWQHPELGLVYPDQFIGLAEEHGLMEALTDCVLRDALRVAKFCEHEGLALRMAVNVSMENLRAVDFPERVAALAAEAQVAPARLILEVTESRLMQDIRAPLEIISRLRLKRIGLSIDDFGTGHSSLAQLRDFPFEELKLDRSFVHGAAGDPALAAIVTATLGMAAQLGMKSVAEGVEDRRDWDFVRAAGCHVAQGYFIARPMPGDQLPSWHGSWKRRLASSEFKRAEHGP
jgi:EAL domain-containing protein (putative c-di-GMP-specific phosphodiesterase class I)